MPGRSSWEGMEPAKPGDTIGLLLELGTLPCGKLATAWEEPEPGSVLAAAARFTVYKNGVRLGVPWSRGSAGLPAGVQGYSWAVSLGFRDDCVAAESMPVPPDTAPAPAPAPAPDWSSDSD